HGHRDERRRRARHRGREGAGRVMIRIVRSAIALIAGLLAVSPVAGASEDAASAGPPITVGATGYYYAMRDQPDFGVGVATLDRCPLHLELRYNYEVRNAGSAFVGWKFSGGDAITFEVTPIVGGMFGAARGAVPGVEASMGWRDFDIYI